MNAQPSLHLSMRDLALVVRREPPVAYDVLAELVELLTAPSAGTFAKPTRNLGLAIQRALDDYARAADELAAEPELPLRERVA
jgi:hypothetical protein